MDLFTRLLCQLGVKVFAGERQAHNIQGTKVWLDDMADDVGGKLVHGGGWLRLVVLAQIDHHKSKSYPLGRPGDWAGGWALGWFVVLAQIDNDGWRTFGSKTNQVVFVVGGWAVEVNGGDHGRSVIVVTRESGVDCNVGHPGCCCVVRSTFNFINLEYFG
jgi:hypothetical protein